MRYNVNSVESAIKSYQCVCSCVDVQSCLICSRCLSRLWMTAACSHCTSSLTSIQSRHRSSTHSITLTVTCCWVHRPARERLLQPNWRYFASFENIQTQKCVDLFCAGDDM